MSTSDPTLMQARAAANTGDFSRAIDLCTQAIGIAPDNADAHHTLGIILAHTQQHALALHHLRTAAGLEPQNPTLQHALAQHLAAASHFLEALEAFNRVRALTPNNISAHVDAAALCEMHAKTEDARQAILDALEIDPAYPPARIAQVRLDLRTTEPDADTLRTWQTLLRHLADTAEAPNVRAAALDILIDVAERLSNFDAAWLAITQYNQTEALRAQHALPTPQHRDAYVKSVQTIAESISPETTARWYEQRPDDGLPAPALLIGFPRSGTTMTEHALDAHPGVQSIEEQSTFEHVRQNAESILPPAISVLQTHEILDELATDHVAALRAAYWDRVTDLLELDAVPTSTLILDKLPLRTISLPLVTRMFPEARILVALRDPRDVCLSCFRQSFSYANSVAMSFFLNPNDTARLYATVMNAYRRNKDAYRNPILEIKYEDTVSDFEPRVRAMLDFLDLEFDPAVLTAHTRTDRLHATPSYHAVQKPISTSAVARWKNYQSQLAPLVPTLQPLIDAFGYDA